MSQKLQELTQKLYHEGVEKAQNEAATILSEAEVKKQEMLEAARQEAETLVANGKKEAEQLIAKGESELKLAARQAISALKQEVVNLLTGSVLANGIGGALRDRDVIRQLIVETVGTWGADFRVSLPQNHQTELEEFLKKELKTQLDKGLIVEFEDRVKSGFRVEAQDGSYMLSFEEQDFERYFQSFIKERTKALLFNEK